MPYLLSLHAHHLKKIITEADRALIIATELDFAKMAEEEGVAAAFYEFASDSAVINRGGNLIKGKEAIREYYQSSLKPGTKLIWAPDFADVSGDIGLYLRKIYPSGARQHRKFFRTSWHFPYCMEERERRQMAVRMGLILLNAGQAC